MQGWIKLHRKILTNVISKKPEYLALWLLLLILANHQKKQFFIFNSKKNKLRLGEFITGRKKLAKISGINESKIERILKYLEIEQQIEQQTFNKFRLIHIVNWKKYQKSEQLVNNKRTKIEQQTFNKFRLIHIVNWNKYQKTEQLVNNKRTKSEHIQEGYKNIKNIKEPPLTPQRKNFEVLKKWFSEKEGVKSPEGLTSFVFQKYSEKIINKTLKIDNPTNITSFFSCCDFYKKEFLKTQKHKKK